jgi:hypothetical protein
MIIEHQGLHGYSLRIQAFNAKHHHLIPSGMQIVDRLIEDLMEKPKRKKTAVV